MATGSLFTQYSEYSNNTIVVTSTAELNSAVQQLASSNGGTILVDGNSGPYNINVGDYNGMTGSASSPVLIKALDPSNPPTVHQAVMIQTSYVTVTEMAFDSSAISSPGTLDIAISGSDHVEFVNNTMTSSANGYLSETGGATQGNNLALADNSSNIVFSHNVVSNYFHGFGISEVKGLTFTNNEFSALQGDGFRGGGLQDAVLSNNYMHDFYGSTQTYNHSDMFQIWGTGATLLNQNIEISGNLLDSGSGAATQSIFIRNENLGASEASGGYFQDIRIFDNVIHNGQWHGIGVADTQQLQIYNNTVLWNSASGTQSTAGAGYDYSQPWIHATNTPGATVYDNIAWSVFVDTEAQSTTDANNYAISYNDPNAANYVDNHIVNLFGYQGPQDLMIDPNSPLYGVMGAAQSSGGTASQYTPPPTTTAPAPSGTIDTSNTQQTDQTDPADNGTTTTTTTTPPVTDNGSTGGTTDSDPQPQTNPGAEDETPVEVTNTEDEAPVDVAENTPTNTAPVDTGDGDEAPADSGQTAESGATQQAASTEEAGPAADTGGSADAGETVVAQTSTDAGDGDDAGGGTVDWIGKMLKDVFGATRGGGGGQADKELFVEKALGSAKQSLDAHASKAQGIKHVQSDQDVMLNDLIPVTEMLDESAPIQSDEDDDDDDWMFAA